MRSRFALVAGVAALLAFGVSPALANHPDGAPTDDPLEHTHGSLLNGGGGFSSVDPYAGNPAGSSSAKGKAKNLSLVGALQLAPANVVAHGDVAGWKNLAFIGKWRGACPGTGVDIIDISRPSNPVKIADTRDYADTSMEDMQVASIGGRDILAIGLQDCGGDAVLGTVGLELYDITDPRNPEFLTLFNGEDFADRFPADMAGTEHHHGHVHELDLTGTPDGRTLALLSSPDLEAITARAAPFFDDGVGDMLIVDISDPENPVLAGDWACCRSPCWGSTSGSTPSGAATPGRPTTACGQATRCTRPGAATASGCSTSRGPRRRARPPSGRAPARRPAHPRSASGASSPTVTCS